MLGPEAFQDGRLDVVGGVLEEADNGVAAGEEYRDLLDADQHLLGREGRVSFHEVYPLGVCGPAVVVLEGLVGPLVWGPCPPVCVDDCGGDGEHFGVFLLVVLPEEPLD